MDAVLRPRWLIVPRRHWFFFGLIVFFLAVNVRYALKIHAHDGDGRSAFVRWTPQLRQLEAGVDIWQGYNYPNPPIMALVLMPFTYLGEGAGALAWFYFKALLTIAAMHGVLSVFDRPERPFPLWGKTLAVALSLRAIQGDLTHGNVNLFILFLLCAALLAFTKRHDAWAGLLLALAIACKITPALFVPYFLWKRAWTMLAVTAAGLGLFLVVVPSLWFGWQQNWTYLQSWHGVMVHPFVVEGMVTSEHQNQSLPGLMARLLTRSPSYSTYEGDKYVPVEYDNLADLDRAAVGWIVKGCMALFALAVLWRCRTPLRDRADWRLWAEYGVIVLGMLLFSERTWKHHAVTLVIPFAVLCYALSTLELTRARRKLLIIALASSSLLMLATSTGFWDAHDLIGKTAQVYGAYVGAFLILAVTLFAILGWPFDDGGDQKETTKSTKNTKQIESPAG